MYHLETERLKLRPLTHDDADFIVELVNDPDWLRFIGDKNVHNRDDAIRYLDNGPLTMYRRYDLGLFAAEQKSDGRLLGMCGLLRRDGLAHADIGFAFLPVARGQGYALEAAKAVLDHAREVLKLDTVLAITTLNNELSIKLLRKLGLVDAGELKLPGGEELLKLFEIRWAT